MYTQPDIVIVDYGMGNLRSVQKKLDALNGHAQISADCDEIAKARKLILPGVGHFASGVRKLKESGIWDVLNHKVLIEKVPILGICLGMQLMARLSEEGNEEGLSWFDADVVRFNVPDKLKYKVPHIGWNTTESANNSGLFNNVPTNAQFYFVHSYHVVCQKPQDVSSLTTYAYPFVSSIAKANIYGTQFHPEKSHQWGEQLLANFIAI